MTGPCGYAGRRAEEAIGRFRWAVEREPANGEALFISRAPR